MLAQASERAHYNFDSLMVPYRAVAAEVFTQRVEVLNSGFFKQSGQGHYDSTPLLPSHSY